MVVGTATTSSLPVVSIRSEGSRSPGAPASANWSRLHRFSPIRRRNFETFRGRLRSRVLGSACRLAGRGRRLQSLRLCRVPPGRLARAVARCDWLTVGARSPPCNGSRWRAGTVIRGRAPSMAFHPRIRCLPPRCGRSFCGSIAVESSTSSCDSAWRAGGAEPSGGTTGGPINLRGATFSGVFSRSSCRAFALLGPRESDGDQVDVCARLKNSRRTGSNFGVRWEFAN